MTTYKDVVTPSASSTRETGRVKWFNNKSGYGFITRNDAQDDIFVHHSAITVEQEQYKYLVQGEYVEFIVVSTNSGPHKYQASNVVGVSGGKLMCETKRDFKIARSTYKNVKSSGVSEESPVQQTKVEETPVRTRRTRKRVEAPSSEVPRTEDDKKEWTLVKKNLVKTIQPEKKPRKTNHVKANESK
jgi:CspA family cold shock protein